MRNAMNNTEYRAETAKLKIVKSDSARKKEEKCDFSTSMKTFTVPSAWICKRNPAVRMRYARI